MCSFSNYEKDLGGLSFHLEGRVFQEKRCFGIREKDIDSGPLAHSKEYVPSEAKALSITPIDAKRAESGSARLP